MVMVGVLFVLVGCLHCTATLGLSFHQSSRRLSRNDDPTRPQLLWTGGSSANEVIAAAGWEEDTPACVRHFYPAMDGTFHGQSSPSGVDPSINYSRRQVLLTLAASSVVFAHPAYGGATTADLLPTDCLEDLPHLDTTSHVRLYLCRHGETEYNRLQIVQGARFDAPLNAMGRQQAALLGQALGRAAIPPSLYVHSPLQRAQTTAQLAAVAADQSSYNGGPPPPRRRQSPHSLRGLDSLSEVDFGVGAEGMPVANKRAELVALYTAWALGDLDARMNGSDGESGHQVRVAISKKTTLAATFL
jgi:broad specificity phosphatase PhoE